MLIKKLLSKIFKIRKFSNEPLSSVAKILDNNDNGDCEKSNFVKVEKQRENLGNNKREIWKLSRKAHQKVPFIVNCLKLQENEQFGRFITSSENLRPGEVIAVEEPIFKFLDKQVTSTSSNGNESSQISQSSRISVAPSFDSDSLLDDEFDWKTLKMLNLKNESLKIVGSVEELQKLFNEPPKTVFDFDLNDSVSAKRNLLKCTLSLVGNSTVKIDTALFNLLIGSYSQNEIKFLEHFVTHLMRICVANQFSIEIFKECQKRLKKIGNCLLPFGSLFNHSCDPNVIWIVSNMKFIFFAAKPIREGEQLFISYRSSYLHEPRKSRQSHLKHQYQFICKCAACAQNLQTQEISNKLSLESYRSVQSINDRINQNWKIIEKNFNQNQPEIITEAVEMNKILLGCLNNKFT